ncbi:hypothetical protein CROQUDRAFT_663911 [Cronartium quercuum f. sp. fusiforme G11]|uniref:Uncharacterized protein n=1 Tax=Cronartium quercuum f. sp. fusiforme G11 TaxID=708437 RepID=A0A9P6NBT7_9BASI|nr:hypothetical protein CROQUDRAFT_663911 [Cronartium quercuum f. sp. fusiforme G11]
MHNPPNSKTNTQSPRMPDPTHPPDPPGHAAKRPIPSDRNADNPNIIDIEFNGTLSNLIPQANSLSPEDRILATWRKCGQSRPPDGRVLIDSTVYDMMEVFLESIRDTKIPQLQSQNSSTPLPTILMTLSQTMTHPLPAKLNKT